MTSWCSPRRPSPGISWRGGVGCGRAPWRRWPRVWGPRDEDAPERGSGVLREVAEGDLQQRRVLSSRAERVPSRSTSIGRCFSRPTVSSRRPDSPIRGGSCRLSTPGSGGWGSWFVRRCGTPFRHHPGPGRGGVDSGGERLPGPGIPGRAGAVRRTWPDGMLWPRARPMEHGVFVAVCQLVGSEGGKVFLGGSMVAGPGRVDPGRGTPHGGGDGLRGPGRISPSTGLGSSSSPGRSPADASPPAAVSGSGRTRGLSEEDEDRAEEEHSEDW